MSKALLSVLPAGAGLGAVVSGYIVRRIAPRLYVVAWQDGRRGVAESDQAFEAGDTVRGIVRGLRPRVVVQLARNERHLLAMMTETLPAAAVAGRVVLCPLAAELLVPGQGIAESVCSAAAAVEELLVLPAGCLSAVLPQLGEGQRQRWLAVAGRLQAAARAETTAAADLRHCAARLFAVAQAQDYLVRLFAADSVCRFGAWVLRQSGADISVQIIALRPRNAAGRERIWVRLLRTPAESAVLTYCPESARPWRASVDDQAFINAYSSESLFETAPVFQAQPAAPVIVVEALSLGRLDTAV